jgi:5-methylcytosine-specific restriction endonuclease McrA
VKYSEKLKDPRWQKQRLEIFARDGWKCGVCQSTENTLNVHHVGYQKGKDPWGYRNDELVTLCEPCHRARLILNRHIPLIDKG